MLTLLNRLLVNEYNVDPARLSTQGFAWDQPIADNNTKEGRAMNRRVFATISGSRTVQASIILSFNLKNDSSESFFFMSKIMKFMLTRCR